ncbi:hypothetical protein PROFUN_00381 [Planoprotostelium fungivorum]|uniref:EF-hand domain-containing protein n=1 Tax=Planoprotostelium fungivorum TaxID=1890364 RepID=A0A2P6NY74_9EUKA|nr:hypothetical protein PROFUN_00381 [Planoprotostelium fungivorum]
MPPLSSPPITSKAAEARRIFNKYDTRNQGSLSLPALSSALRELNVEATQVLNQFPQKGGRIMLSDFLSTVNSLNTKRARLSGSHQSLVDGKNRMQTARKLFSQYDPEEKSIISLSQAVQIFTELDIVVTPTMKAKLDPTSTDRVGRADFLRCFELWLDVPYEEEDIKVSKPKTTEEQMETARAIFAEYDTLKNGTVDVRILRNACNEMLEVMFGGRAHLMEGQIFFPPSQSAMKADQLMQMMDTDGTKKITFIKFLKGFALWNQIREATVSRINMMKEMEDLKALVTDLPNRKATLVQEVEDLRKEWKAMQENEKEIRERRMQTETEILSKLSGPKELTPGRASVESRSHVQQTELKEAYTELNDMHLLSFNSSEFYVQLEAYLRQCKESGQLQRRLSSSRLMTKM